MGKGVSQQPSGAGLGPEQGMMSVVQKHPPAEDVLSGGAIGGCTPCRHTHRGQGVSAGQGPVTGGAGKQPVQDPRLAATAGVQRQLDTLTSAEVTKSRME